MIRYALIGAVLAALALCAALYRETTRRAAAEAEAARLQSALDLARDYITTTKGIRHATSDLPDRPDDVLAELCRIAPGGEGCGNP